jgi:hypothetical protein
MQVIHRLPAAARSVDPAHRVVNLPPLDEHGPELLTLLKEYDLKQNPNVAQLLPRVTQRLLDRGKE